MTSSSFFEQTAATKLLALDITDLLNICHDNVTEVAFAPMACKCEREIWNTESNKMKVDNERKPTIFRDLELKWDNNLLHDKDGHLCFLMAKCYQYILVQHSAAYHHDTFA